MNGSIVETIEQEPFLTSFIQGGQLYLNIPDADAFATGTIPPIKVDQSSE